MSAFHDQLQRLADQIRKRLPHVRGEEATKQALILPFLSALGYDIYDPTEVQPEFTADFAKKRSHGQAEKVDYAIRRDGSPVIFIECKAADAGLGAFSGQLARYFNATPACPLAIFVSGRAISVISGHDRSGVSPPGSGAGSASRGAAG